MYQIHLPIADDFERIWFVDQHYRWMVKNSPKMSANMGHFLTFNTIQRTFHKAHQISSNSDHLTNSYQNYTIEISFWWFNKWGTNIHQTQPHKSLISLITITENLSASYCTIDSKSPFWPKWFYTSHYQNSPPFRMCNPFSLHFI